MHTNWQVCCLVVLAKSERISDISTQLNAFSGGCRSQRAGRCPRRCWSAGSH